MKKTLYEFTAETPPVLNEGMLRQELERRRKQRQAVLLVLAMLLSQSAVALLGILAVGWVPWLSALCFAYVVLSAAGSGVLAVLCTGRKEKMRQCGRYSR